ncbi:Conserved protein of uncharacterised function (13E12 repeat family protein) [Mycobacterium tuberculosis]|nr:Conserved protein of uncharacterised function (13E12 repeat family protein) [Mycobacterium tuberculosis]
MSAAFIDRICSATRAENRAAAAQLVALGELFAYRWSRCGGREEWVMDTMAAVAAEVAAALRISQGLAASRLRYARAMRERLPKTAEVFSAGDIGYLMFATIVYRTDLIVDPDVLAAVDAQLAANVARWPSMTKARLAGQVDKIVARADADAVRRRKEYQAQRQFWVGESQDGVCQIGGSLLAVDDGRDGHGGAGPRPARRRSGKRGTSQEQFGPGPVAGDHRAGPASSPLTSATSESTGPSRS